MNQRCLGNNWLRFETLRRRKILVTNDRAWVCIYILDGGHFSFPDADADLGTTRLALSTYRRKTLIKMETHPLVVGMSLVLMWTLHKQ
jgi:hypothetical protein